jgi:hypothetical protein
MNKKALDSSFILHPFSRGQQQPRQPARQGGTNVLESGGEARRGVPELFQSSLRADGQRRRPPHPPVRRLLPRAHHGRMRRRRNRPVAERFPHRGDQRRQSIADAGALVCRHSGVRNHLPDFPLRLQTFQPKGHQRVTSSPRVGPASLVDQHQDQLNCDSILCGPVGIALLEQVNPSGLLPCPAQPSPSRATPCLAATRVPQAASGTCRWLIYESHGPPFVDDSLTD